MAGKILTWIGNLMNLCKFGVKLECFGVPLRKALLLAAQAGAQGVQFDAVGELSPAKLSESGRREISILLRSFNLQLAAIFCPLRNGLDTSIDQEQRLIHVKQNMDLAFDLGSKVLALHAGQIPQEKENSRIATLTESLTFLGAHGDRAGVSLALETGLESGKVLADFLATIDSGALGAGLNPGNLKLHGHDPLQAVLDLGKRIKLVHATEFESNGPGRTAREVPLGKGDFDWNSLMVYLDQSGFHDYLICEKNEGTDNATQMINGLDFLKTLNNFGS